ncbi:PfkB family carbohydrate kinase [Halobacteriovorax sp. DA5]|uniref:PfkB family carbohydrate kinase n=1 Tax=Halobacteriovorax sp. DA5 TaxID=2067553 RepID=UPI000CD02D71|nr:PfkB family carbohydrate kinase [Halobacteriovorax sp. DA5]POB15172.1 hypothetical protein C0Z22_01970 [Halobacteriovorax sp. DA5]
MYTFIGDAGFDVYSTSNEKFLGGCSLNVATHFKRNSNLRASLIYPAASDGQEIISHCQKEDIQAHPLERSGKTPIQFIETLESGEKNFTEYQSGVIEDFALTTQERNMISALEGYIICPLYTQVLPFIDQLIACSPKAKFIFDFHDASEIDIEKYLKHASLAQFGLVNDHPLEDFLYDYVKSHEIEILITRGKDTISKLSKKQIEYYIPIPLETVVDSTGAGDAFLGAYLALNNIEKASQYAKSILSVRGAGTNREFKDL